MSLPLIMANTEQLYRWRGREHLPARYGQLYRLVARCKAIGEPPPPPIDVLLLSAKPLKPQTNARLIEFIEDGFRAVTDGNLLRKA